MSLQNKYRPQKIKDLVGNDETKEALASLINRKPEDVPHSYLLTGPSGCGKTTIARILKNELGILDTDYQEIDASTDRGIESIRSVKKTLSLAPLGGDRKAILFDEVHGVTGPAQEAMLKMLEEPPKHAFLFLATTNPEKLKRTAIRRCHQIEVGSLNHSHLMGMMKRVLRSENKKPSDFQRVMEAISEKCWGSPGQALKLLDMVYEMEDQEKALSQISDTSYDEETVIKICRILVNSQIGSDSKWKRLRRTLKEFKGDPESTRYAILGYMNSVMLGDNSDYDYVASVLSWFDTSFIATGKAGLTLACYGATRGD